MITKAQIFRFRRILSGTNYHAAWDGRYVIEMRSDGGRRVNPIMDKSMKSMFARGWVEFDSDCKKQEGCHYPIRVSATGMEVATSCGVFD